MIGRQLTPACSEQNSSIIGGLVLSAEWIMDVSYMQPALVITIVSRSNPLTVTLEGVRTASLDFGRFVRRELRRSLVGGFPRDFDCTRLFGRPCSASLVSIAPPRSLNTESGNAARYSPRRIGCRISCGKQQRARTSGKGQRPSKPS